MEKVFHVGERIKQAAQLRKLNTAQLADLMNVSQPYITKIFKKSDINTDLLWKFSVKLDFPITYFLGLEVLTEDKYDLLRHKILNLRSYINQEAIKGRGLVRAKFQEDIGEWNLTWAKLDQKIDEIDYKEEAKEINNELKAFFNKFKYYL